MKRSKSLTRGKPPRRKTRLNQVGAKARREAPSLAEFRRAVRERAGGLCELAPPACSASRHDGYMAHHRCPPDRDRGIHDPGRGLWTCGEGHSWVHDHPAVSYEHGWLLRDRTRCESCGAPLDALGCCEGACAGEAWEA